MIAAVISRGGVPVRLTAERWQHIVEEHAELAGLREEVLETIANAEAVYEGLARELMDTRQLDSGQTLVVIYRGTSRTDGFIITAFLTSDPERVARRPRQWPPMT